MATESKPKKYIIQLKEDKLQDIKNTQRDLGVTFTSSAELSSTVRAQDVMNAGNGLYLKNLGIAIVEDLEIAKIENAQSKLSNPIVYWEEERTFKPVNELEMLTELKEDLKAFSQRIEELEVRIEANKNSNQNAFAWGLNAVGLAKSKYTGKGVDLCVLDTGFYKDHPDFVDRIVKGKSFITGENWETDPHGHGTHCAGIAAGNFSISEKIRYGVAYEANLIIGKVLSDRGMGSTSAILDAIDNSLEKKHKIISMSLGSPVSIGEKPSPIFEQIGQRALANNTLLIAAAGNDSKRPGLPKPVSSPANAESIMGIGALDEALRVASFSNGGLNASNGGRVDISAPGTGIYSSYSANSKLGKIYRKMNGTSMATPFVSGIAALYWEAFPNASAEEIWLKLEKGAKKLDNQLYRDIGQGIVQAI
ncbi:S8 family serine peptidase [Leeuwenhoekiella polynyae]|uniref:Subtilase family protein n=1 Tax=Leeuwenhoekiella polynyae TaxID=1550906 RepID=A0A4Q0NR50_9FLAO|nr:S8 family serine peptidase [Leeuwenhoekiella polynyae]RXG12122.1 subtilase family protein [Leeuwenhoekiella polynyae]